MKVKLGAVSHFSVAANDPNASAAWWTLNFDLEEWSRSDSRIVLGNDSIVISLFAGNPDPATLGHLAFRTSGMDTLIAARDSLRDNGAELEDPGDEIGPVAPGSKNMGLWFHDIDSYRWELYAQAPP